MKLMQKEKDIRDNKLSFFKNELKNFEDIATRIKPLSGEIPKLSGIDIYGESIPYNGIVGGDHIIYIDFNKRYDLDSRIKEAIAANLPEVAQKLKLNKTRAGVLIADVSGHNITDTLLAAMLHQAFLVGVLYELKINGEISSELFENLNTRFFNSASLTKFITLIYGEISESGKFRFINAGHPAPLVYSQNYQKTVKISFKRVVNVQPIGTLPSKEDVDIRRNLSRLGYKRRYSTHEINLMGVGDVLILYTDGLTDLFPSKNNWDKDLTQAIENSLVNTEGNSAKEILKKIKNEILHNHTPSDDLSLVIIKKMT
jgi:serine phosphatase RsbU (regulator of sigma subunit)